MLYVLFNNFALKIPDSNFNNIKEFSEAMLISEGNFCQKRFKVFLIKNFK